MKKLLTAAAMAITLSAAAQIYPFQQHDNIPIGAMDTVMAVFLLSDTSYQTMSKQPSFSVFGYAVNVRKKWVDSPGTVCWNCPNFWELLCYLDSDKRPLNKNYIVWDTKRIKP